MRAWHVFRNGAVRRDHACQAAPEQGFRSCLGILRLAKEYGADRLEAACRRGNDIGARSHGSIASILQHGLDRAHAQEKVPDGAPIRHANIRGQGYYH
jgi:transposase